MNPLRNPNSYPNPAQIPNTKSLTFDEVSNFFSLPLSDAADSLGICTTVLKKICHDNGLVRWPYRKFVAGKSIEEIKKEAVVERKKQLAEMPSIAGERASEVPNKTPGLVQETSKSRIVSQLQGSKSAESGSLQNVYSSSLTKGTQANSDEFKYGFPSDGLSTVSYRWWGDNSPDGNEKTQVSNSGSLQEKERQSEALVISNCESLQEQERQSEALVNNSAPDGEKSENHREKINMDAQQTSSLSAIRKRAAKEGRTALKLGVYQGNGVNKLDWNKRAVLLQIFKTSLPNQWEYGSS